MIKFLNTVCIGQILKPIGTISLILVMIYLLIGMKISLTEGKDKVHKYLNSALPSITAFCCAVSFILMILSILYGKYCLLIEIPFIQQLI